MTYKVSDLKKIVSESSNEFKAVLGDGVESENKKNNKGKTHDEISKEHYGQKLEAPKIAKYEKTDYDNRSVTDAAPANITPEQQKLNTIHAQGYNSELEKNNNLPKNGDFEKNKEIVDAFKKSNDEYKRNDLTKKSSGLEGRVWAEKDKKIFDKNDTLAESKEGYDMRNFIDMFRSNSEQKPATIKESVKTVYFKKTTFLNEEHMMSRIPDEFKNEGSQFKMKDKTGNEYLLEWTNNAGRIIGHSNKNGMNESLERMKSLYSYSSNDTKTTQSYRLNEGESSFVDTLDKVRKIK